MSKKSSEFYVKIHHGNNEVIAVCDSDILGKTLEENDLQLKISENFYKDKLISEEELINILKKTKNLNVVGNNAINLCLKLKIIEKEHVLYIQKIPHAQLIEL